MGHNELQYEYPNFSSSWTLKQDHRSLDLPEHQDFLTAELLLLANVAADRAEMRAVLAIQRDNWNKLFQHTLTAALMTATVLAALSGSIRNLAGTLSLVVPALLLNLLAAAVMSVVNHFQPSQLAEEQRAAGRLYRKLITDVKYAIRAAPRLQMPKRAALRDLRRRLSALDKAFPMPLTPGGLEKFPSQIRPPVLITPQALPIADDKDDYHSRETSSASRGWNAALEAELRRVAGLLARSDIATYTRWAQNVVRINRALATAAPLLAAGAGLLNMVQLVLILVAGDVDVDVPLGMVAAVCSAMAAFVGSFSSDMQVGMVAELYRNSAGYYASIEGSIKEVLESPVEEREDGELFRQRIGYQLGRFPAPEGRLTGAAIVPEGAHSAGALF